MNGVLYEAVSGRSESHDWRHDVPTRIRGWKLDGRERNTVTFYHTDAECLETVFEYDRKNQKLWVRVLLDEPDGQTWSEDISTNTSESEIPNVIEGVLTTLNVPTLVKKVGEFEDRFDIGETDDGLMGLEIDVFFDRIDSILDRIKRNYR